MTPPLPLGLDALAAELAAAEAHAEAIGEPYEYAYWAERYGAPLLARLANAEAALRYISSPTMALPGGVDPEIFAVDGASEQNARQALANCIRIARTALTGSDA